MQQRKWTMTEELDLGTVLGGDGRIFEDMAQVDGWDMFAVGDNDYVAVGISQIHFFTSLQEMLKMVGAT